MGKNRISAIRTLRLVLIVLSVFILISRADSFGASIACAPQTPCLMHAGEERMFSMPFQTSPGEGDVRVKFELLDDAGGIAQIVGDNEFLVPAGSENVNAKLKVKIPDGANVGSNINVVIKFSLIPSNNGGQVGLSPSFTMNFPLSVVGEEVAPAAPSERKVSGAGTMFFFAIGLILVVLVAITFVLIKNKNKQ